MQEIKIVGSALDLAFAGGIFKTKEEAATVTQCFGIVESRVKQIQDLEETTKKLEDVNEVLKAELKELEEVNEVLKARHKDQLELKPGPGNNQDKVGPSENKGGPSKEAREKLAKAKHK